MPTGCTGRWPDYTKKFLWQAFTGAYEIGYTTEVALLCRSKLWPVIILITLKVFFAFSFPRNWIKGNGYPEGIDRNMKLSKRDKEHVKRLYGPSRLSGNPSGKNMSNVSMDLPDSLETHQVRFNKKSSQQDFCSNAPLC